MSIGKFGLEDRWPRPDQAAVGALDQLPADRWPMLAAKWLATGFDSPSLRQLAQLPAPVLKRVPLVPLLERVVSLEIRLDVRLLSAPDVELLADEDQIEQLLINLVRNAVESAVTCADEPDASAPGSDAVMLSESSKTAWRTAPEFSGSARSAPPCTPEVTIHATDDGDLVSIRIEDNGPGLANPENLFVPLYTTKKAGSGVVVEQHRPIEVRGRGKGWGETLQGLGDAGQDRQHVSR